MCLYFFIVELNIWKKISMNLGLWRPRIVLSQQRNISKKSCRSRQKYIGDTCLVHSARPSGMPHRCFTRGICEHAGCPRQPPPCHWQGQARRRDSRHAETSAPRHNPAWQGQWRFPSPTWACSSGAEQFFIRLRTSTPCPHYGRKPRHKGSHSTLGTHPTVVHHRATYPLSRQRPSKRMNNSPMLSTTSTLLKPVRRVCNRSKNRRFWVGGLLHNEKSGHVYKPFSESGARFQ